MSGNVPVHDYIFAFRQQDHSVVDDFIYELGDAQNAMYKSAIDDVKLAQELRVAEAYVKELKVKCEIATNQRIKAKKDFDAAYAKITALMDSNA